MQDSKIRRKTGRKRGPAPFKPTPKHRKDVSLYAAGGMSEPAIAAEIGIAQNTLRKHFADELRAGHDREHAANLRRLRKAADAGNVTAMKHLDMKFGFVGAQKAFDRKSERKPRTRPLGKREIAEAAAAAPASGDWSEILPANRRPA